MNVSRREFFSVFGAGTAAAALPGCICPPPPKCARAKIALQLYSIRTYIGGTKDKDGNMLTQGAGLAKAFRALSAIGYKGVEFAGYYDNDAKTLKAMLDDNGLVACGTHVGKDAFGPEKIAETCEFNLGFGNNLIICPGGGNMPEGGDWSAGRDGTRVTMTSEQEDFTKKLVDYYNAAAASAAKYGCRIGLHNHMWEHGLLFRDGTSFWDYFFSNTDPAVCMEQDVGWSTCAGVDPAGEYAKYPHRSPTLHAKENGMGKDVASFDAILGKPGKPGAKPVDWDALALASERDGVEWYVVECEKHFEDFSAVLPSCNFLKSKGLG